MANFSQLTDDKNALCYVWLAFVLFIIAVVCFGVSSHQSYALYAGIVFLILSTITALLYLKRRWHMQHPNLSFCEVHCGCCQLCCECCYYGDCYRYMLCLPPVQRNDERRMQRLRRRLSNRNATAETHAVVMNHVGYELTIPSSSSSNTSRQGISSSIESKLRRIENDIQNLFQQYSYLQTDAAIANSLMRDYNELVHQHEILGQWIENTSRPVQGDMQQMKQCLKRIRRNFRLARARFDQDRSVQPDLSTPLHDLATSSTSDHQSRIYTTELAGLPPYQVCDPLKTFDTEHTNSSMDTSRSDCNRVSERYIPSSAVHGQLSRLGISAELGSLCSLAPPEDESGAPPSYEEAVSTSV